MQISRKRSFLNSDNSLPPGVTWVQYLEKTSGSGSAGGGVGSWFASPSKVHYLKGIIETTFSFGPSMSQLTQDCKMCCGGLTPDSTSECQGSGNTEWIYGGYFRGYPTCGTHNNNCGITSIQKEVIYTIGSNHQTMKAYSIKNYDLTTKIETDGTLQSNWLDCYKHLFKGAESVKAPRYTRIHRFTFESHDQFLNSIDMIPVDYNGTPCFYDLISKTFCYEIGGTGYFMCGPVVN